MQQHFRLMADGSPLRATTIKSYYGRRPNSVILGIPTGIPLTGHTAKIVHLAFSSDSKYLASSSWDRRVGLWDVGTLSIKQFLTSHKGPVNAAQFSKDGKLLFSGVLMDTFASGGSRLASSSGVLSGTVLELM